MYILAAAHMHMKLKVAITSLSRAQELITFLNCDMHVHTFRDTCTCIMQNWWFVCTNSGVVGKHGAEDFEQN